MSVSTVSINADSTWEDIKEAVAPGGLRLTGHRLDVFPREEGGFIAACACGKTYRHRIAKVGFARAHQWHLGRVLRNQAKAERNLLAMVERIATKVEVIEAKAEATTPTAILEAAA